MAPGIFTFTNQRQEHHLAFWCDGNGQFKRYFVVPFNTSMRDRLIGGRISVREALDQPWLWVVNVDRSGHLSQAWR